jgi:hypothetical protein
MPSRVILIGRLALYGPGAARLHEELIPVTARWVDPLIREGPLTPYAREAESRTLALLDSSLLDGGAHPLPEQIVRQLKASAPKDVEQALAPPPDARRGYARDAKERLLRRGELEAKAMLEILQTQKKHLEQTVAHYQKPELQLTFQEFKEEERRQLEANQRYWDKRLTALENELRTEPERIRAVYQVCAQRIEPVGLVYLWPITG